MKNKFLFPVLILGVVSLLSFKNLSNPSAASKTADAYNFIYVDNSKNDASSLTNQMIEMVNKKVDSAKTYTNSSFLIFISDGPSPAYSKAPEKCAEVLNRLVEGNSQLPYVMDDKKALREIIYRDKLAGIKQVNMNFFLTDYYIKEFVMKENPGYLLNFFPKEIALLANCPETAVNVYLYYSNKDNVINAKQLAAAVNYYNSGTFASKINYRLVKI